MAGLSDCDLKFHLVSESDCALLSRTGPMKGENKLVVLAVRLAADIALISLSLVDFLLSRVGKCGVACLFSVLTY